MDKKLIIFISIVLIFLINMVLYYSNSWYADFVKSLKYWNTDNKQVLITDEDLDLINKINGEDSKTNSWCECKPQVIYSCDTNNLNTDNITIPFNNGLLNNSWSTNANVSVNTWAVYKEVLDAFSAMNLKQYAFRDTDILLW